MINSSRVLFLTVLLVSLGSGCQSGNTNLNVTNVNGNARPPAVAANQPQTSTSGSSAPAGTPTAAYVAAFNAMNNKDIQALKNLMSKDVLALLSEMQKTEKKSLDETLRELCEQPRAASAEVRNEKFNGDTATLEYKDEEGEWQRMDFIKEDGVWKLTIPKAEIREMAPPRGRENG